MSDLESLKNRFPDQVVAEIVPGEPVKTKKQSAWVSTTPPISPRPPPPPQAHSVRGLPIRVSSYLSLDGDPLGYVYHYISSTGDPVEIQLSWCVNQNTSKGEWHWKSFPEPRWLYGLERLKQFPGAKVLLVHNELAADSGNALLGPDYVCVSWPGGPRVVDKVDYSPLHGRQVIIWPACDSMRDKNGELMADFRQPGLFAANKIAAKLMAKAEVSLVAIPSPGSKPHGWGLAEAIEDGMTAAVIESFISGHHIGMESVGDAGIDFNNDTRFLRPVASVAELIDRYWLIYAHGSAAFDRKEKMIVKLADIKDLCLHEGFLKMWKASPDRQTIRIQNVGFDPRENDPNILCNLWAGWPMQPKDGKCELLLELLEYMCQKEAPDIRQQLFDWVIKWLACPLQHPGAKMKTCLVYHGPQGTGKNLVFEAVKKIYGEYGRILDQKALESEFTEWGSKKLFIIADEVVARSEVFQIKNQLKVLITGDTIRINPKNILAYDETNHINIVFLSNERMPVVLEEDDRRHAIVWTPDKLSDEYYQSVAAEMNNGGIAALYHHLLHVDLTGFNEHTKPPMTEAKQNLIELSKDSIIRFYEEWVTYNITGFDIMPVLSDDLYEFYRVWCHKEGVKSAAKNKFVDLLKTKKGLESNRWRVANPSISSDNPQTFLVPDSFEFELEDEKLRKMKLGDYVNDFREALNKYRGRNV